MYSHYKDCFYPYFSDSYTRAEQKMLVGDLGNTESEADVTPRHMKPAGNKHSGMFTN